MTVNENAHNSCIQNDVPNSFSFIGNTSEITKNGNVKTAHDAIKIENEKAANGIQL